MEQRYIATFVLHAVGDMIGFKNGEWEFNYHKTKITLNTTNEILYDFIALGGINQIDFTDWNVSDDTMMNIAVADAVFESHNNEEEMYSIMKKFFIGVIKHISKNKKVRYIGNTTKHYINKLLKNQDANSLPYDPMSGGNGAAMRTACIGLALHGKNNRDKLIKIAVESSRITHNSPIGWLGGVVTALFTSYAIEGIPINEWIFELMKIFDSGELKKYIRKTYEEDELDDYEIFISNWKKYLDVRFDEKKLIKTRVHSNLIYRVRYHFENFTADNNRSYIVGDSGYSSTIMAYDSLLDCDGKWETLIIYSALHPGDGDTVASIACAWYGAVYGMENIPKSNYKTLEFGEYLIELGKKFYNKFYLNEKNKSFEDKKSLSRQKFLKKL